MTQTKHNIMDKTIECFEKQQRQPLKQNLCRFLLLTYLFFINVLLFGEDSVNPIHHNELRLFSNCESDIDNDSDGINDSIDLDDDNDGIPDKLEFCIILGEFNCLPNNLDPSGDEDGDGIANFQDANDLALDMTCNDNNGDGICDQVLFQYDLDGDNIPNHLDLDSDNDGITDLVEAGHAQIDANSNGIIDGVSADFGLNGLYNAIASDANALDAVATYIAWNKDADDLPDYHDLDSDNDGINDVAEAGFGAHDTNNNGRLPLSNSIALAGLSIVIAPIATGQAIPLPTDTDLDLIPDWHDLDSDNDGINDVVEAGKPDDDNDGIIGTGIPEVNSNGHAMEDANGIPLLITSLAISTDGDNIPDYLDLDSDADGISDVVEGGHIDPDNDNIVGTGTPIVDENGQVTENNTPTSNPTDTDNDGHFDFRELDSDKDGILDEKECPDDAPCADGDNDGRFDFQDIDRDNDGIEDTYECETGAPCVDTDNDGTPDVDDLDTDNDGLSDTEECPNGFPCPDSDGNNIDDFRDYDCHETMIPQIVDLEGEGTYCAGLNIEISAMNANPIGGTVIFRWAGPNGFLLVGTAAAEGPFSATIFNAGSNEEGTYTLTLESEEGCFSNPQSIFIDINEPSTTPMIGGGGTLCAGESVSLEVTNDLNIAAGSIVSYHWFAVATNAIVETTIVPRLTLHNVSTEEVGEYYLNVRVNDCISQNSNVISIQLLAEPAERAIIIEETVSVCEDQELLIEAIANMEAVGIWTTTSSATIVSPNDAQTIVFDLEEGENTFIWTLSTAACGDYSNDTLRVIFKEDFVNAVADTIEIDNATMLENYNLLANDELMQPVDNYVFSIIEQAAQGELSIEENGTISYIPEMEFSGVIEFTYEICSIECSEVCVQASVEIRVNKEEFSGECFIPNTFTPNGDGMNDAFSIDCLEFNSNNKVMIFNRWGDKVFEKENYRNDWIGTFDGQDLPPGTYFYIIKLDKTQDEALQGYMSLLR